MSRSSLCYFLWGTFTGLDERTRLVEAFRSKTALDSMELTLYKRTGQPFRCNLTITPIKNERSQVVLFLCVFQPILNASNALFGAFSKMAHSIGDLNRLTTPETNLLGTISMSQNLLLNNQSKVRKNHLLSPNSQSFQQRTFDCKTFTDNTFNVSRKPNSSFELPGVHHNRDDDDESTSLAPQSPDLLLPSTTFSMGQGSRNARDFVKSASNLSDDITESFQPLRPGLSVSTVSSPSVPTHLTEPDKPAFFLGDAISVSSGLIDQRIPTTNQSGETMENYPIPHVDSGSSDELIVHTDRRTSNASYLRKKNHVNNDEEISGGLHMKRMGNNADNTAVENHKVSARAQVKSTAVGRFCRFKRSDTTRRSNGREPKMNRIKGNESDSSPDPSGYNFHRRKSLAVLQRFPLGKQKRKNKDKLNKQLQNFSGKKVPEYKMQHFNKPNSVLLHYGLFRIVWDWILLLFTFYIAFMVPYNVAFGHRSVGLDARNLVPDLIVEILLIIDVVLNFNTTYVNKHGQLVYQRRQLALHYLRGWLLLDALAALPVDFLLVIYESVHGGTDQSINTWTQHSSILSANQSSNAIRDGTVKQSINPGWNTVSLLHMMKLTRLLRLARLFQNLSRLSQNSIVVLGLLMFTFTLFAHWSACVWYVIGIRELESTEANWLHELARRLGISHKWNKTTDLPEEVRYFTALYFTCSSLTSVGFGNVSANTTAEKVFAISIMLLGALMHAAIFGNVTAIIQRIYARRTAFQSRSRDLKDFIHVHHIPKPLKQRMQDFFQTMWAINRGIDSNQVLNIFPEELRRDIALYLNRELLSLKVFQNASQDCLKSLAVEIKTTFFTPGEFLIHTGDVLHRLHFVCSGSLEILENNEVVALLGKNDWFGTYIDTSIEPIQTTRSRCDVKSLTYCDLQSIDLRALNKVLNQYPKFKDEFIAYLLEDLSFNIREGAVKYMDSDAVVVPAITLQLAHETSGDEPQQLLQPSMHSRSGTLEHSVSRLLDVESGPHASRVNGFPYIPRDHRDSTSSSNVGSMRYYPRREGSIEPERSYRRATLGALFTIAQRKEAKLKLRRRQRPSKITPLTMTQKQENKTGEIETGPSEMFEVNRARRHTLPVVRVAMVDEDSSELDGANENDVTPDAGSDALGSALDKASFDDEEIIGMVPTHCEALSQRVQHLCATDGMDMNREGLTMDKGQYANRSTHDDSAPGLKNRQSCSTSDHTNTMIQMPDQNIQPVGTNHLDLVNRVIFELERVNNRLTRLETQIAQFIKLVHPGTD